MIGRAFALAASVPWAIDPMTLRTILAIAAREGPGPAAIAAELGRPLDNSRGVTVRDGVATIPIQGPLFRYASAFSDISGATSYAILARDLRVALAASDVDAIVIAIDSPGGEVSGVHELASMIFAARGIKPIVAYVGGAGASAAYWIAAACDRVICDATATVGSIGVVRSVPNPAATSASDIEIVSSVSPDKRPDVTTDEGRAVVQRDVDAIAAVFVGDVARFRGVSAEAVARDFGRGGVLVGCAAVDAGMVDAIGSYEGTIEGLRADRARARVRTGGSMNGNIRAAFALSEAASDATVMHVAERLVAMERSLLEATGASDAASAMGVVTAWKAAAGEVAALQAKAREHEARAVETERAAIVTKLRTEKRITPILEWWAEAVEIGALRAFAQAAPVIGAIAAPLTREPESKPLAGKRWEELTNAERHDLHHANRAAYDALRAEWKARAASGEREVRA